MDRLTNLAVPEVVWFNMPGFEQVRGEIICCFKGVPLEVYIFIIFFDIIP
jgi:hypothetical protein